MNMHYLCSYSFSVPTTCNVDQKRWWKPVCLMCLMSYRSAQILFGINLHPDWRQGSDSSFPVFPWQSTDPLFWLILSKHFMCMIFSCFAYFMHMESFAFLLFIVARQAQDVVTKNIHDFIICPRCCILDRVHGGILAGSHSVTLSGLNSRLEGWLN